MIARENINLYNLDFNIEKIENRSSQDFSIVNQHVTNKIINCECYYE